MDPGFKLCRHQHHTFLASAICALGSPRNETAEVCGSTVWICQVFTLEKDRRIAGGVAFVDAFCLTKETGEIEVTLREQTVFNLFFQTSGGTVSWL